MKFKIYFILVLFICFSCGNNENSLQLNKAQQIILDVQKTYGVENIVNANFSFDFRQHTYVQTSQENDNHCYKRIEIFHEDSILKDTWCGNDFYRTLNEETIVVSDSMANLFKNSINSVFYFTTLPKSLSDDAVIAELIDTVQIFNQKYHKIKVTFKEEGGGEDFEDIYYYWFDFQNNTLDYFAYEYFDNEGGIRFRKAINRREVNGFLFQDYINYKPVSDSISLDELEDAFQNKQLEEVSKIENKNILFYN